MTRRTALQGFCAGALACLATLAMAPSAASAKEARLFAGTFGAASNPAPFPANPYPLIGGEHRRRRRLLLPRRLRRRRPQPTGSRSSTPPATSS